MVALKDIYTTQQIVAAVLLLDSSTDHHYLGGSSLYRRVKCHASAIAEQIDGAERESKEASKGTFIHGEIESALTVGDIGSDNLHVKNACGYVQKMKDEYAELSSYTEHRLTITDPSGQVISFGTVDWIGIDYFQIGHIRDWKTGAGWETCYESQIHQGRFYIAAAILAFNLKSCDFRTFETLDGVEKVEIGPRDREWAESFRDDLLKLKTNVIDPYAEFAQECGDYCQYCKLDEAGKCPVRHQEARIAGDGLGLVIPDQSDLMDLSAADEMYLKIRQVRDGLDALEKNCKPVILAAGGSENFKVQKGYEYKKTDWEEVVNKIDQAIGSMLPPSYWVDLMAKIKEYVFEHTKTITVKPQIRERKGRAGE